MNDFRCTALGFPEATESAHMGHPDFRVRGKIFATLGYPGEAWGVVKLTPEQQRQLVRAEPETFVAVKGAWGRQGNTQVCLRTVNRPSLRRALVAAWNNVAPRDLVDGYMRLRRGSPG